MAEVIRMSRLKDKIGLSRSQIYELVKCGDFPKPISLGLRAVGWLGVEVDQWIQSKAHSRIENKKTM